MSNREKKKKSSVLRTVLIAALLAVFCVSGWQVVSQLVRDRREANAFDELASQLQEVPPPEETPPPAESGGETEADGQPAEETPPERKILGRYAGLYERNQDLFGWLAIEGTKIDYPVMHTPDDPQYYLHRDFEGQDSSSGVPFLDGACFEGCGNYIVYGHHMKNGTMFACLPDYADKSFWEEHPVIRFDTLWEAGEYEVMAAFYSRVYGQEEKDVFRYYAYRDLTDPERFEKYVEQVQAAARYSTGVEAEYGDQLLTLSTCSYHTDDGRFVVVARRKNPQE